MSKNPVFTIIVPVYKVEQYLDKCVRSLIAQTYPNIEIILVDDGSPDSCPRLCDAYAREDERIRVIHKPNGGLSDARNAGIDAATGQYVLFLDSDDYITLDACERLLPFALQEYDVLIGDGVSEGAFKKMTHGSCSECCTGKDYLKAAVRRGAMPMAAVLYIYRLHYLHANRLRFKVGITHEDEEFTPRAFLSADRVMETGVNFYRYVIRDGSITTTKDLRRNCKDLYETCLELQSIYNELDDQELKQILLDSLVVKYLSLFQAGRMYRHGKAYIHKRFVAKNAYSLKTKLKAGLFLFSPALYWRINDWSKR